MFKNVFLASVQLPESTVHGIVAKPAQKQPCTATFHSTSIGIFSQPVNRKKPLEKHSPKLYPKS
jgi:hypothetical protein